VGKLYADDGERRAPSWLRYVLLWRPQPWTVAAATFSAAAAILVWRFQFVRQDSDVPSVFFSAFCGLVFFPRIVSATRNLGLHVGLAFFVGLLTMCSICFVAGFRAVSASVGLIIIVNGLARRDAVMRARNEELRRTTCHNTMSAAG
jgi:hypothetical protein